jgi:hypothetical protein
MEIIVFLLVLSQVYLFYTLFKRKKDETIPKDSIILKPIPKDVKISDVEGVYDTISDLLQTAKNENWQYDIEKGSNYYCKNYDININSPSTDDPISISGLIRIYTGDTIEVKLIWARIKKNGKSTLICDENFNNELILFFWDFVLEENIKLNSITYDNYKKTFDDIRKSLKSINRNKKIDELLNDNSK